MKSNSENLNIAIAIFENNRKIERTITIKEAIKESPILRYTYIKNKK